MNNGILIHHGIKGMKWGVRRYQNKDGTLTDAGKKRYDVDIDTAKKRVEEAKSNEKRTVKEYYKKTLGGTVYNRKEEDKLKKARGVTKLEKRHLDSERIKGKLNEENGKKSKHRLNLEKRYQDEGMSREEAEIAAYKRERTEKIIAVTAGVTIAAAAAYVARRHYDKTVDKFIKAGTKLQNISNNSNKGVSDAFYFSMTSKDNVKYRGIYGNTIQIRGDKVFETKINVKKTLKVASEKSATRALSDLVKNDSAYAETLRAHLEDSTGRYILDKQNKVIEEGLKALKKGEINFKVYNALNLSLANHSLPTSSEVSSGFYNKLKTQGYDVVMDMNDKRFSGYKTQKPMIAFNVSSKTEIERIREVGREEIKKAESKGMLDIAIKSLFPSAAGLAGTAGLVCTGMKALDSFNEKAIIQEYRKEHPGTELSNGQILNNYYKR